MIMKTIFSYDDDKRSEQHKCAPARRSEPKASTEINEAKSSRRERHCLAIHKTSEACNIIYEQKSGATFESNCTSKHDLIKRPQSRNSRRSRLDFTRNKKATTGPQAMIFSLILAILLLGTGMAVILARAFGTDYDFREADATLIQYQISSCLSENEFDFSLPLEEFKTQLYKTCGLNQQVVENEFYIFMREGEKSYKIGSGDHTQCALADKNPDFMKCTSTQIAKTDSEIFLETGSNQKAQRIRT